MTNTTASTTQAITITEEITKMGIEINLETITPARAQELLERGGSNRRVRPYNVDLLARDIAAGKWQLTHQGIALNDKGELIDGQHRLHAIVKAGKAVQMFVSQGFESDDALGFMVDTGSKRTFYDVHKVNQYIAKACVFMATDFSPTGKVTYNESAKFVAIFKPDVEAIWNGNFKVVPVLTSAPVLAAAVLCRRMDLETGGTGAYAVESFRRLREMDTGAWTPIEVAFGRAMMRGDLKSRDRRKLFMKSLGVFNEATSENTRMYAAEDRYQHAKVFATTLVKGGWNNG